MNLYGGFPALRMRRMRRQVMEHNIYRWAASVLGALREIRIEGTASSSTEPEPMGPEIEEIPEDTDRKLA